MTREFAVEGGISAEDVPTPPNFTAQSAGEDETRSQISEWRSEVRALGLDPAAALRIVSEDSASADAPPAGDAGDADGEDDEYRPEGVMGATRRVTAQSAPPDERADADDEYRPEGVMGATRESEGDASAGWLTAARRAASAVPDGWRPQSLFADDGDAGSGGVLPGPGVEEYDPRDPEDVNDAILNPDTAGDPWAGALGGDPDAGASGVDLDEHRDAIRSSTGDYRGKAGPNPTSAQSAQPSYQTGVNYVGADSARSRDAFERASGEDDDRPRGVFTADPDDDPEVEDDEHRPSGLFTEGDA